MKKRIFITATNTDIGKTYVTQLLLEEFAARGMRVGVIKPIETGVVDGVYPDGELHLQLLHRLNPLTKDFRVEDVVPLSYELPAAPCVASGGAEIDMEAVKRAIVKMEEVSDILLIEGAGGLYVPVMKDLMVIDLIKMFKAKAVLVTHCSLGCINDTLVHVKALEHEEIKHELVFNCKKGEEMGFESISKPFLGEIFSPLYTSSEIGALAERLLAF